MWTCAAFSFLAVAHHERWELYVVTAILGIGMGLAVASLGNLIVEAAPPERTRVAIDMNNLTRTLGGAVGAQIGASIIGSTVVGTASPTERSFTLAFFVVASVSALATIAALSVPRRRPAPGSVQDRVSSRPVHEAG